MEAFDDVKTFDHIELRAPIHLIFFIEAEKGLHRVVASVRSRGAHRSMIQLDPLKWPGHDFRISGCMKIVELT